MAAWRAVAGVMVVFGLLGGIVGGTRGQTPPGVKGEANQAGPTYSLAETPAVDDHFRFHLDMSLAGELRIRKEDKKITLPVTARAAHDFTERVLIVGKQNLAEKTARVYEAAKADITIDKTTTERTLRPDRRLIVAQRANGPFLVYSPAGPLTRLELELTSEHFDTLALTGLLPGKPVGVGETWKLAPGVVQALCNFDGLTAHDVTATLKEVKGTVAVVTVAGTADGIDVGSMVKLTLTGTCRFDLTAGRIVAVEWVQKDERDQGPASPASVMETTTKLTRAAVEPTDALNDVALVSVPDGTEVPDEMTQLTYPDAHRRFELGYDRAWQLVSWADERAVFRLLDRGDFVAQASVTVWPKAPAGKHTSPEDFETAMSQVPGWEPDKTLQAGEIKPADGQGDGRWVYRVTAAGHADGMAVVQTFYLVASAQGEQLLVGFMMTPKQVDRLEARDVRFVEGITFPAAPEKQ